MEFGANYRLRSNPDALETNELQKYLGNHGTPLKGFSEKESDRIYRLMHKEGRKSFPRGKLGSFRKTETSTKTIRTGLMIGNKNF